MELSFGEQIKILLNRNHMTIQDLADRYEAATGCRMSRQNLTQRLKRDNFPEQDMKTFASLLGYRVSIQLEPTVHVTYSEYSGYTAAADPAVDIYAAKPAKQPLPQDAVSDPVFFEELDESLMPPPDTSVTPPSSETEAPDAPPAESSGNEQTTGLSLEIPEAFRKRKPKGEINPLTGEEYLTNTVRRHPDDPDYIQVYDRITHTWSDVAEDYFWDFQQKKKQMLGSEYQEPLLI